LENKEVAERAARFYKENATNVVNVPRPGHPEDKSGWDGVRRASEARFIAQDALVMTLADAIDFAAKFAARAIEESRQPAKEPLITECCLRRIQPDERYCPKCGWECRVLELGQQKQLGTCRTPHFLGEPTPDRKALTQIPHYELPNGLCKDWAPKDGGSNG